ncbi:MAG TPA: hypothetical protein VMQ40_01680 [Acidimicrobiales bacterium]|nr:hypothetical protein [Acidimicrobiales bacterium]
MLVNVVGLHMNPPGSAMVFSFDEKTQVQALDRTQPSLPLNRGRGTTMTHDYTRHGTTDLFAVMNVATSEVLYDTKARHSSRELLSFFSFIELHVEGVSRSTSCSTTSRRKSQRPSRSGSRIPSAHGGTCTSRRPARRGSTWSRAGSHRSPLVD